MSKLPVLFLALTITLAHLDTTASAKSPAKNRMSSAALTTLLKLLSPAIEKSLDITSRPKIPMQPIEPIPLNPSLDYFNHIFNFLENMRHMENDIKKRTYSYGLMVVGRPLEELSFNQKLIRAALMPSKYYEDATSFFIQRLHNYVNSSTTINKPATNKPSRSSFWGRFLRRFLNSSSASSSSSTANGRTARID